MQIRKYSLLRIIPLVVLSAIVSCSDVPDSDLELQPTQLRVRVIDENYQQVTDEATQVYLYRDYVSFLTKTGAVASTTIAENGFANFTNLEPYNYFIYAVFNVGDNVYDNSTSAYNLYDYLTENAVTTITVKTNLARSADPTAVEVNTLYIMPFNANTDWVGQDYDTVWSEYMIVKDYDYTKKIDEQNIVARSTSYFPKKVKFGEFRITNPVNGSFDPAEIILSDVDLSLAYYDIVIHYFGNKSDYLNRSQIYAETLTPTGYFESEFVGYFNERLVEAKGAENPYPQLLFIDQTYTQKNNYLLFTKLTWK